MHVYILMMVIFMVDEGKQSVTAADEYATFFSFFFKYIFNKKIESLFKIKI